MRHEIHRLPTITDAKGRHAGCLQCAATGFIAYDRSSNSVGCFPTAERELVSSCNWRRGNPHEKPRAAIRRAFQDGRDWGLRG